MISLALFCSHLILSLILSILLLSPLTELLNFIYCIFQLEHFCLALLCIFYFFVRTLSAEDFCFSLVSSLLVIVEAFLQWLLENPVLSRRSWPLLSVFFFSFKLMYS